MEERLIGIYCIIDDFVKEISPYLKDSIPTSSLSLSEILSISVLFHGSDYRTFKHFYLQYVCQNLKAFFPNLVSYCHFVKLKNASSLFMKVFLEIHAGDPKGIYYIDSTPLPVCKMERKYRHRVFKSIAKTKKSTFGFFHGLKLHLLVKPDGELMAHAVTSGNKDDRALFQQLTKNVSGKVFADRGYLSEDLFWQSLHRDLKIITRKRCNSTYEDVLNEEEYFYLKRRRLIETVFQQLKERFNLWHTRFRSVIGGIQNLLAALLAYSLQHKKPSLKIAFS